MPTKPKLDRVFVDTNILINEYSWRKKHRQDADTKAAFDAYQFLRKRNFKMFAASFAPLQFASSLTKYLKVGHNEAVQEIKRLTKHLTLVQLTNNDLIASLEADTTDIEDAVQYTLCKKVGCTFLVTLNVKDFNKLAGITVVKPTQIRAII